MATELLTAVREKTDLIVFVFNNGTLGLIERKQLTRYGHAFGTQVLSPDLEVLCQAMGVHYHNSHDGVEGALRDAQKSGGVHLIELELRENSGMRVAQAKALVRGERERVKGWVGRLLGR